MKKNLDVLKQDVDLPTAPFVEGEVIRYIKGFVAQRPQLRVRTDPFGNLMVRYTPRRRNRRRGRPILFSAHMDHPGFSAVRMTDKQHVYADFRGWVRSPYFKNERVQFYSGGEWVSGRTVKVIPHRLGRSVPRRAAASARSFGAHAPPKAVVAQVARPVRPGSPGMWASAMRLFAAIDHARACDDVAGLAAIPALDAICREEIPTICYAFSHEPRKSASGTLAAIERGPFPKRTRHRRRVQQGDHRRCTGRRTRAPRRRQGHGLHTGRDGLLPGRRRGVGGKGQSVFFSAETHGRRHVRIDRLLPLRLRRDGHLFAAGQLSQHGRIARADRPGIYRCPRLCESREVVRRPCASPAKRASTAGIPDSIGG